MFLKLQRLLSQQAVLIKTMFHLFLMIINCPCNEKKLFCWEDYTTLWSNRFITDRHPRPLTGVWKILPGTGHHFFHSQPSWPRVPFAVTVRRSPEALPHHHCPRPRAGWKGGPPYLEQKKGSPERGAPPVAPAPPSVLPSLLVANKLALMSHLT